MRKFNTAAVCIPKYHYMVDLTGRLQQIKEMVDDGKYFTINRARQYGKTTTLKALEEYLADEYLVVSLDFQMIDNSTFRTAGTFARAFSRLMMDADEFYGVDIPHEILEAFEKLNDRSSDEVYLDDLFRIIRKWCKRSDKPVVLFIDEVDSATNNQVFLDFLAQLRGNYIRRETVPTFHSVILAGVTDIKNLKRKIRPDEAHKHNSPWNIAADFVVDMSFHPADIAGMLEDYENDHHTGMDIEEVSQEIYDYTCGYPFLVCRICQLIDENLAADERFGSLSRAWTKEGISEVVRRILMEPNTLFESLMGKVLDNGELSDVLQKILFSGEELSYSLYDTAVSDARMYGFVQNDDGKVRISNRIFEMLLYNHFLATEEMKDAPIYKVSSNERSKFIVDGQLDMEHILKRYVECDHQWDRQLLYRGTDKKQRADGSGRGLSRAALCDRDEAVEGEWYDHSMYL